MQSLDPAIAYDTFSWPLVRLLFRGLYDYGEGTELRPWLAAALPTVSADGRVYRIPIRPGVTFSNGRELVAGDFVYTLERILDPRTKSPGEGFFRNIAGAREFQAARERDQRTQDPRAVVPRTAPPTRLEGLAAPDRYTLAIRLVEPDLAFLNVLAMPFAYPVPREEVERHGPDFYRHPMGTGPMLLDEWIRGMRLRFSRRREDPFPDRPQLEGVHVTLGLEPVVAQMMFERGELDYLDEIAPPDFVRVTGDPRWQPHLASLPWNATLYVSMNCELPPFTDRRVRQAMNYAVDKERLLRVLNDRGVVARGVLPPLMPGHNPRLAGYPYNPERARRLLRAAGHGDGFAVTLWAIADNPLDLKAAQVIQQDLAQVGVRVALRPVAFAVWNEASGQRRNVAFTIAGWYQDYPDPSNFFDVLLRGDRIQEVASNNYAFYASDEVDGLLHAAAKETDQARRLRLYQEAEERIVADAPWIFLYHPVRHTIRQPWVKGYRMHPVWVSRHDRLRIQ